jgi:hypothetical protein
MKIFHYHSDNGLFLGEGKADPSPLETDVWLIPAHATSEEPPEPGDGEQVVWIDSAWRVQLIPIPEPEPESILNPEPPPELTTEQKLEAAGLTVAELRELLGLT